MVARPAEQLLSQIAGIEHTYSVARPGVAVVTVQFKVGVPRTEALVRLYDVLNANQDWLPRDLGTLAPIVKPKGIDDVPVLAVTLWDESQVRDPDEDVVILHNWDELRRFLWDYVGIVRTNKRLQRALRRVELLQAEIQEYYSNYKVSSNLVEMRNLVLVGELIIRSALARKESRGLHYTLDYPEMSTELVDTILVPPDFSVEQPKVV